MDTIQEVPTKAGDRQKLVHRLALWSGIAGPLFFILVFTVAGWLTPGYSAMRDVVSFLELGPTGWIQRLNFLLTGLMLIFFARGVFQSLRPKSGVLWLWTTSILIALSGTGLVMAAPFLPDVPGSTQVTVQGMLHTIAFTVVFLPLGVACLCLGIQSVATPGWRLHGVYSLLAGLFPIFAALGNLYSSFVISNASSAAVSATSSQMASGGLINRVLIILAFAWYVILAIHLLWQERRSKRA